MIDNFELISSLLNFNSEDEFLFCQIIQRKKDFKEQQKRLGRNNNNRLIKAYFIYSVEQLYDYKEEMIKLAEVFNARVCINLNKRNQREVCLRTLGLLVESMRKNEYKGLSKAYTSACGKENTTDKLWIVDLDKEDLPQYNEICKLISEIEPLNTNKIIAEIPTKNGLHLITTKFNRKKFSEVYPNVQIHCNNPTILYVV